MGLSISHSAAYQRSEQQRTNNKSTLAQQQKHVALHSDHTPNKLPLYNNPTHIDFLANNTSGIASKPRQQQPLNKGVQESKLRQEKTNNEIREGQWKKEGKDNQDCRLCDWNNAGQLVESKGQKIVLDQRSNKQEILSTINATSAFPNHNRPINSVLPQKYVRAQNRENIGDITFRRAENGEIKGQGNQRHLPVIANQQSVNPSNKDGHKILKDNQQLSKLNTSKTQKFVSSGQRLQSFNQEDWSIPEDNPIQASSAIRPARSIILSNKFAENEDHMNEIAFGESEDMKSKNRRQLMKEVIAGRRDKMDEGFKISSICGNKRSFHDRQSTILGFLKV